MERILRRPPRPRRTRPHSSDQGATWTEPEATACTAPDSEALLTRIPSTDDLLLVWNNVESTSNWPRTPLTAAVSADEGATWGYIRDIDARPEYDAAYPHVFFQGDEAVVTYYTRLTRTWARDSEVALKIFPVEAFYD